MDDEMDRPGEYQPRDYSQARELDVLSDIQRFQDQLAELPAEESRYTQARRQVYLTLLRQRRQLLAAIRAGRPSEWQGFHRR